MWTPSSATAIQPVDSAESADYSANCYSKRSAGEQSDTDLEEPSAPGKYLWVWKHMNLDLMSIRPLNGSRSKGFEELCAQLARRESPDGATFERKGSPDAGVECYSVLESGQEWGWQAKYFHTLGTPQWRQIDDSVRTALTKHPELVRYFICVPLDRPDAREGRRWSAMEHWRRRVKKWKSWASDRGMDVEFEWWGQSELLSRLSQTDCAGLLRFWFDSQGFDETWFRSRLQEAFEAAGPRYTAQYDPDVHVDLPITNKLEMFGRTETAFDRIRLLAREVRRAIPSIERANSSGDRDEELESDLRNLVVMVRSALGALPGICRPDGIPAIDDIVSDISNAAAAASRVGDGIYIRMIEYDAENSAPGERRRAHDNPYRERRHEVARLERMLDECYRALSEFASISNSDPLMLNGQGGTGKTHLLCDFAKMRVEAGAPVVLLMGQEYLNSDPPWVQTLERLDLRQLSREQFIGSMEAAAQAANSRALIIIDALNEGRGRELWRDNLASFLAPLRNSPWIGVILSVRSPYQDYVVPEQVMDQAVVITHDGFSGVEFEATRTFFDHHGIEFPSAPLLQPEFRNPLFLKTLCKGLQRLGRCTLPRGSSGITSIFDTYLRAINTTLADRLDYDRGDNLVRESLAEIARYLARDGMDKRWLPKRTARDIANGLLPGQGFSRSLYRALVSEGLLLETITGSVESPQEIVQIAYERFADHVIVDTILNDSLRTDTLEDAFKTQGELAFLTDGSKYLPHGILEALCIQVPERTGRELTELVPELNGHPTIGECFRQSIVWRSIEAFSESTRNIFDDVTFADGNDPEWELHESLETLLTVSIIPGHPFNADLLESYLRKYDMPDRDAWWSTYLHSAWGEEGAVDRLVHWASKVTKNDSLEAEVVNLGSTTLAWMLTTPNRFLRDKTTKALVSLLTDRLDATAELVDRFSDVDDPYVLERVYAVAYGVSMRSAYDSGLGRLAHTVYDNVFKLDMPHTHILLRDYARGVIEHAVKLGSEIEVDEDRFRPPYKSVWPSIPDEEELEPLRRAKGRGRNKIASSLSNDFGDFYIYVIGRGSTSNWLSLRLDEPAWQSPKMRLHDLLTMLEASVQDAWNTYERSQATLERLIALNTTFVLRNAGIAEPETIEERRGELEGAEGERNSALERFCSLLSPDQLAEFGTIAATLNKRGGRDAPRLNKQPIRRYVLWRVFDLGWTEERFGRFDSMVNYRHSREGSKPERIGKKYQWIAYHEILACIADRFQYRDIYDEDLEQAYDGPWQELLRDIDPSCTLGSTPGGTHSGGRSSSWWAETEISDWGETISHSAWIAREDGIPPIEELLIVDDPNDNSRWVNLGAFYLWQQPIPADTDIEGSAQREINAFCTGYLLRSRDAEAFMKWAEGVNFWGRWMPEAPEMRRVFIGECQWSMAFQHAYESWYGDNDWIVADRDCPAPVQVPVLEYQAEEQGYDCSIESGYMIRLPHPTMVRRLSLQWDAENSWYVDAMGNRAVFDPSVHEDGPSSLLIREDLLNQYLSAEDLTLCWAVLGEKLCLGNWESRQNPRIFTFSGAYRYADRSAVGSIRFNPVKPRDL